MKYHNQTYLSVTQYTVSQITFPVSHNSLKEKCLTEDHSHFIREFEKNVWQSLDDD